MYRDSASGCRQAFLIKPTCKWPAMVNQSWRCTSWGQMYARLPGDNVIPLYAPLPAQLQDVTRYACHYSPLFPSPLSDKACTSLPSRHHPCHAPGYRAATHQAAPRAPSWRQAQLRQPSCLRQPAPPPSCLLRGQSGLQLLCWSWRRPQRQSLRQSWHPALPGCRQTCRCSR